MPVTLWDAVLGKFLAAWIFAGVALILTFPIWLSVNFLGEPDNGAILAGYIGGTVDNLNASQVSGLEGAIRNARAFAAEVVALLRQTQPREAVA